jgi:hypothetical protein
MKGYVRAEPQGLDEIVPVNGTELNIPKAVILGKLARDLIGNIEVPPIVHVHAQ